MARELVLVMGGVRSGKSTFAQRIAEAIGGAVLFVATAEAGDREMEERIAVHRKSRPAGWDTLEEPVELAESLRPAMDRYDVVLLDCLTLWVSNLLVRNEGRPDAEARTLACLHDLLHLCEDGRATWILVSNEVGMGVVPPSPLGRTYRDTLGRVNQAIASRADRVYWLMAGLALDLKALGACPLVLPTGEGQA